MGQLPERNKHLIEGGTQCLLHLGNRRRQTPKPIDMSWWSRKAEPTAEELAAQQAEKNARTLQGLQDQYEDKMEVAANYGKEVHRLGVESGKFPPKSPHRVPLEKQQKAAFAMMKEFQRDADLLWSKIQALRRVTSNVQSMHTNIELHNRYKESNEVSTKIAGGMEVDEVTDTMDAAHEHLNVHNEISQALAGRTMGGVVDEDDEAAEMAQFMEGYEATGAADVVSAQANPGSVTVEQREAEQLSDYEATVLRTLATLSTTGKQPAAVSRSGK